MSELARRAGVTQSYISQLERGGFAPSLSVLYRLAKELAVPVPRLLGKLDGEDTRGGGDAAAVLTERGAAPSLLYETGHGMRRVDILTDVAVGNDLVAYLYDVADSDIEEEPFEHPGEDFVYVLAGRMIIIVGDDEFKLDEGDSLHINGTYPHRWQIQSQRARVILVASHPI